MPIGIAIGGAAVLNYLAADKAADQMSDSYANAASAEERMYQQSRQDQMPWYEAGKEALPIYQSAVMGMGENGRAIEAEYIPKTEVPRFDSAALDVYRDPSYDFRVKEGERVINRNMAGMGKTLSGNRLAALQEYGQEMGSQEYANMYNRALTDYKADSLRESEMYGRGLSAYNRAYGRDTDYRNSLASLAGQGQQVSQGMANQNSMYANSLSNLTVGAGQAQAAGTLGKTSAITNAMGSAAGWYGYNQQPQQPGTNVFASQPQYTSNANQFNTTRLPVAMYGQP